jgi:hypothetical protein
MKKFLIVAGVLAVVATPAFAQSFDPEEGTGNIEPFVYGTQGHQGIEGEATYGQAPKSTRSVGRNEGASRAEDIDQGPAELREYR